MYQDQGMEQETKFLDINGSKKLFLINIFSMQLLFHALVILLTFSLSWLPSHFNLPIINTDGLNLFAMDMWFVILFVACPVVLYIKIKNIDKIPLYFIASFPAVSLFISSTRIASSWLVFGLTIVSCAVIFKVNYVKLKQG